MRLFKGMDFLYEKKHRPWLIALFWSMMALLLTTRSAIGQLSRSGVNTWLQNFYYQGSGAVVWAIFTPLLIRFYKRFDFHSEGIVKSLLAHLALSIPLALAHRALALMLDFGVRVITDMNFFGSNSVWQVLSKYRWVILESSFSSFITYWTIIAVLMAVSYFRRYKAQLAGDSKKPERLNTPLQQLKVRQEGGYVLVPVDELVFCEASGNYVLLHTTSQTYKYRETLGRLEGELGDQFVRVHRSTIVNLNEVESFRHLYQGEYLLKMSNGKQVSSTRSHRDNLQPLLQGKPIWSQNR